MSAVYATTSFTVRVTAAPAHDETLLQGDQRDTASAVYVQTNATSPSLWSAVPPVRGSIPNSLYDYLLVTPAGP